MKPSQQLAAMAVAGLCGTAFSLPQIPYYTSRFPQHPQNLGFGGDYPKYWQGEAYSPPQEDTSYYNPSIAPPEAPSAPLEQRPLFTDRKYPAREAIKYYGGSQFPVNEEEGSGEPDKSVQNVKIKNDTPFGDNDKSFTRITKSSGPSGIGKKKKVPVEGSETPAKRTGGLETIADAAIPEFNGAVTAEDREDETEPENWNSFTLGVVSDTLVYHDPYENREGGFERKTNAMDKIEKMMGREYSKKDTKSRRSLGKRDWPEHIQEKALKMMDSASNMQTKGQKTIDNDPAYQESLRAKNPTPEPAPAPKSSFPVAPKSKGSQQAPPPKQPESSQGPRPQQKKKPVGSGGGDLVPPGKSEKLGRAKSQSPPPQQQGPRPQPNQNNRPSQQQQPRKSPKDPRPPSDPNQPRQPSHKQPNQKQPKGDMARKTGNSKQPQQNNFPSQDLPRKGTKGSGLNTPNQRPQNSQKKPQNGQKRPQNDQRQPQNSQKKPQDGQMRPQNDQRQPQNSQKKPQNSQKKLQTNKKPQQKPQQKPQNNLHKRQVAVPAGPNYPPGTTIIRRPYVAPQPAAAVRKVESVASAPAVRQIPDGQIQRQHIPPAPPYFPGVSIQHQHIPPAPPSFPGVPIQRQYAPPVVPPVQPSFSDWQVQRQHVQPATPSLSDIQIQHQYMQPAPPAFPDVIKQVVPPVPFPAVVQHTVPAPVPAPVQVIQPVQPPVQQAAPAIERTETVHFAAIVHPGKVICAENKPCPQPEYEYREKTVFQPVQRLQEVEVTREGVRAIPKLEAVDVVSHVDVVKEKEVEKQIFRKPACESCEQARPRTMTVCADCREAVGECTCGECACDNCACDNCACGSARKGDSGSYSRTFSNGREASAYGGPGPVSGPGGLEAFFRQRMPEHFAH